MRKIYILATGVLLGISGCTSKGSIRRSIENSEETCSELIAESTDNWVPLIVSPEESGAFLAAAGISHRAGRNHWFASSQNDRVALCSYVDVCDSRTYIFEINTNGNWSFLRNAGWYKVCLATHNKPLKSFASLTRTRINPAPLS